MQKIPKATLDEILFFDASPYLGLVGTMTVVRFRPEFMRVLGAMNAGCASSGSMSNTT